MAAEQLGQAEGLAIVRTEDGGVVLDFMHGPYVHLTAKQWRHLLLAIPSGQLHQRPTGTGWPHGT